MLGISLGLAHLRAGVWPVRLTVVQASGMGQNARWRWRCVELMRIPRDRREQYSTEEEQNAFLKRQRLLIDTGKRLKRTRPFGTNSYMHYMVFFFGGVGHTRQAKVSQATRHFVCSIGHLPKHTVVNRWHQLQLPHLPMVPIAKGKGV